MRLWSLHPRYLDSKGLVAVWRESLLAKRVLEGYTKGYRNHPQLARFRSSVDPLALINHYLASIYDQAEERSYSFNPLAFDVSAPPVQQEVTRGQLEYEAAHLLKKLEKRSPDTWLHLRDHNLWIPHPVFRVVEGDVEEWEIRK